MHNGAAISVLVFDQSLSSQTSDPDAVMAANILASYERDPTAMYIVLAGNLHAKISRGTPWDADLLPMGCRLLQAGKDVVSLNNAYANGTAWVMAFAGSQHDGPEPDTSTSLPAWSVLVWIHARAGLHYFGSKTCSAIVTVDSSLSNQSCSRNY